ncbi:unnamed protein product [Cochlearia groenlandica]
MAENNDGKRKTTPSLPANYISFLHLQERWKNDEERKRKEEEEEEEEERRRKQQQQQQTIDLNSKKTDPVYDGESRLADKEETTVARGEVEATREKTVSEKKTKFRKRYNNKKKKKENQDDVVATTKTKEDIVECRSIAADENHTPVAKKTSATAVESQPNNLSIERGEKSKTRSSNLNRLNRKPDSNPRRVNLKEDDVVECGSLTANHTPATAIETKSDKNLSIERGEKAKTRSVYLNRLNRKPDSNPRRVVVEDDNVEGGSIRTENRTKKAIQVYRKKAVTNEDAATAIETQSEKNLSMKTLKAKTRSRRNQRRDLHPCRVAVEEEEDVVETERYAPVKDMNRVYRKKGEKEAAAIVGFLEKAVVIEYDVKAIETQFDDLSITRGGEEKGGIKNVNARPSDCYRIKQRLDFPHRLGRMATLVWVKKEQKDREMVK